MTTPILPQPPKKTDPQFDEWMFRMWKTLVPAASGSAVWSPTDKHASLILSAGQLTATATAGSVWYSARATKGLRRGKWYWEIAVVNTSYVMIGIMTSAAAIGNPGYPGYDTYGYGYYPVDGQIYTNAGATAYGNTYAAGDIIGVALDMDGGKLYFYKNGTVQNSGTAAVTGLSGTYYPAIGCQSTGSAQANFGAIPFAYPVPDGYNAGVI